MIQPCRPHCFVRRKVTMSATAALFRALDIRSFGLTTIALLHLLGCCELHAQLKFAPPLRYPLTNIEAALCMTAIDLNGDSRPDIALCTSSGGLASVTVYLNKGDGTLLAPVVYAIGPRTAGLAVIDL